MGKPLSLFAVSGSQRLLRDRFVRAQIKTHLADGWRVDYADGNTPSEVQDSLSQGGLFFEGDVVIVVQNPEKVPLKVYEEHMGAEFSGIVLLLDYPGDPKGNTKFGKFLKGLSAKAHRSFPTPDKVWEVEEAAIEFCLAETKEFGFEMTEGLAKALLNRVGSDLGILAREIEKAAMLAKAEKSEALTSDHVRRTVAPIMGSSLFVVVETLSIRNTKKLLQRLQQVKRTSRTDPTIGVCSVVGDAALRWLGVVELRERGIPVQEAASRMGQNPWFYENRLMPQARRWSVSDIQRLLQAVSESMRGVVNGHAAPWIGLCARLAGVCGGVQ